MTKISKHFYEFGPFRLDPVEQQVWRNGEEIALTPKAFGVLLMLIRNGGHAVTKEDFMRDVWPDTIVEEKNLTDNISILRQALGDDAQNPTYIKTVPRRGYRFVADVNQITDRDLDVLVHETSQSRIVIEEEDRPAGFAGTAPEAFRVQAVRALLSGKQARPKWLLPLLIAGTLILTGVIALAASRFWTRPAASTELQTLTVRTIAVLPFKPLVADASDPSLELGMTDALITKLSNIRQIAVRPTSSVLKYAKPDQDLKVAGNELNVDVLVDGKVQKAGDRVRLSVQLLRANDGTPFWGESFDENFTNVFALQDRVSERVAAALSLKLTGEEKRGLSKRYTESTEAYQLYLNGRYFFNKFTSADHQKAAAYFQQAIAKDPGYALAHSGLADTFGASAFNGWLPTQEAYPKAMVLARKAVELDGTLAEAHSSLGALSMVYELDWATAEQEFNRAAELNASNPSTYQLFSYLLVATGRLEEGVKKAQRALELDPVSASVSDDVAAAFYYSRRYDEAIKQWQRSLELEPSRANAHYALGMTYEQKGMFREAFAEYQLAINLSERTSQFLGQLGHAYAVAGRRSEGLRILHELEEMSRDKQVASYDLALLYTGLGERDKAIEQLNRAYEDRNGFIIYLGVEPQFDPLRSDPRYTELLRRMNLSP